MKTILKRVIPIAYTRKNKILYFDAIKDFNTKNFRYLEKAKGPFSKYATHMLKFPKIYSDSKLDALLKNIYENIINKNKIQYGVPIYLQLSGDDKQQTTGMQNMKSEELEELLIFRGDNNEKII